MPRPKTQRSGDLKRSGVKALRMEERELRSLEAKDDTSSEALLERSAPRAKRSSSEALLERSAPNRRLHERTHSIEDTSER